MKTMNRREILGAVTVTVGVPAMALAGVAAAAPPEPKPLGAGPAGVAPAGVAPAFAGKHQPVPLRFNPAKLAGLSERMLVSHHDNNYAGAVKNLNKVEEQLAATNKDTPGFLIGGLKERELTFTNSMILHEQYFGNLGGNGKASGAIQQKVAAAYGGFARWEEHFRAVGASLGGGSGWAIVDYPLLGGEVRTYWAGSHTQTLAGGLPLLVMDMYEHAYAIDYGAAAPKYIDAFFHNLDWDVVNARLEAAEKAVVLFRR
jgi:superoxide dismutase, Fe-Mn family